MRRDAGSARVRPERRGQGGARRALCARISILPKPRRIGRGSGALRVGKGQKSSRGRRGRHGFRLRRNRNKAGSEVRRASGDNARAARGAPSVHPVADVAVQAAHFKQPPRGLREALGRQRQIRGSPRWICQIRDPRALRVDFRRVGAPGALSRNARARISKSTPT